MSQTKGEAPTSCALSEKHFLPLQVFSCKTDWEITNYDHDENIERVSDLSVLLWVRAG